MKKQIFLLIVLALSMIMARCTKEDPPIPPVIPAEIIAELENVTDQEAVINCQIVNFGNQPMINYGVFYSKNALFPNVTSPSIMGEDIQDGKFSVTIKNLEKYRKYYYTPFVRTEAGINYGESGSFTTHFTNEFVTDIDGNVYPVVKIGNQYWMAENLRVTKLRDGTPIPLLAVDHSPAPMYPAMWYYDDDPEYAKDYGALYTAQTAIHPLIAPEGWRVPTSSDIYELADYLGGLQIAGGKLKETGTEYWLPPNIGATNSVYFFGRGAGIRVEAGFNLLKTHFQMWTNSFMNDLPQTNLLHIMVLSRSTSSAATGGYVLIQYGSGRSIRLIKNQPSND